MLTHRRPSTCNTHDAPLTAYLFLDSDASDIDRFNRLNERWIGVIDDLMGLCDGRSRDEALERAVGEYDTLRARLVSVHETVNRRTLYRLQVLGGIMAASGIGQFVMSLVDPSFRRGAEYAVSWPR